MGLFNNIFGKKAVNDAANISRYFQMLSGYTPAFTNAPESVYEYELTRAAIHSFANFCAKLKPEIQGSALRRLEKTLQFKPNPYMDTYKFIYRVATILSVNNTAFIIPLYGDAGEIAGYFPLLPQMCEVVEVNNAPYLRYTFSNGQRAAIEFDRVGVLTRHQYADDFFGNTNGALKSTLKLLHAQNEGIIQGVKNSASVRFLAKIANLMKASDITAERERFTKDNLSSENQSGVIIYDNKFEELKPIDSKPFTVNALQMQHIAENVYAYFGTSAAIIQNKYNENEWNAYYEGAIEPFALQLSLVLSNMTFSERERAHGNGIIFTANRLQYASNNTKLQIATQLLDRGLLNRDEAREIFNLSAVEGGDVFYIRKEYAKIGEIGNLDSTTEGDVTNAESDGTGISGNVATIDGAELNGEAV